MSSTKGRNRQRDTNINNYHGEAEKPPTYPVAVAKPAVEEEESAEEVTEEVTEQVEEEMADLGVREPLSFHVSGRQAYNLSTCNLHNLKSSL